MPENTAISSESTPVIFKRKTRNYINNADLLAALIKHRKDEQEGRPLNRANYDYIGQCILLIANKVADKFNFSGYSYKEEMIGDAIENCILGIRNFDGEKYSLAFAYFTTIVHYAYIRRIEKEKLLQYVKIKNMINHFTFDELFNEHLVNREVYDNNMEYIYAFEQKRAEKKKKAAKPQGLEQFMETNDE